MSRTAAIRQFRSMDFLPGFSEALTGYVSLCSFIENTYSPDQDMPIAEKEDILAVMEHYYMKLSEITSLLDTGVEFAEAKKIHMQAFRAAAGHYVWQAPFFRHAYDKPRGYAGDFQMMEWMYDAWVQAETHVGRVIQEHFMRGEGPRSVRYRRKFMCDVMKARATPSRPLRVLSVASGSAGEVRDLFFALPDIPFDIFLLDQDQGALDFVEAAIAEGPPAIGRIHPLRMRVREITRGGLENMEPFDLIYSMGLYDYLPQPFAVALTQRLIDILAPGGQLVIANYASEKINLSRFAVEYAQDWFVTTRNKEDMYGLIAQNHFADVRLVQDAASETIHILIAGEPIRH